MTLRSLDRHADRHPMPLREDTTFHAALAAIGGIGPSFLPAQRGFGHRSVHTQPVPLKPAQLIKLLDSGLPQLQEDASLHPLLKAVMCGRMRTEIGLIESLPLAAGSQDVENRVSA